MREAGGLGEEAEDEEEHGTRVARRRLDPREPTDEERRDHEMTHLPYRSWCEDCVKGRGKEEDCRRTMREADFPEVSFDFCFLGEEGSGQTLAVLVGKDRRTGMMLATVTPRKSSGQWMGRRCMAYLREIGCEVTKVTLMFLPVWVL